MKTTRKYLLVLFVLGLVIFGLWLGNRLIGNQEDAAPDHLDLGTVYVGSTVHFSAKFLASSHQHPFDKAFDRLLQVLPQAWHPRLSKLHPKNFRKTAAAVDLATLTPEVQSPSFVHVRKVNPEQRSEWYEGKPFVVLELALDTTKPGAYAGKIKVSLDRRWTALPVNVVVKEREESLPRLLIASTPYQAYATEDGSHFDAWRRVISALPLDTDYLSELPARLDPYRVVLLADATLVRLASDDMLRLRLFVDNGGRLIFACNAFMAGSVSQANQVLTNYGLHVSDQDYSRVGQAVVVTNLPTDRLTRGVRTLQFHRPSLINVAEGSSAKVVAFADDERDGFVAVSRPEGGGEVVVLTQSLWWHWLDQYQTNSDNSRLLGNILNPPDSLK
ncbi:MAG TPA: hypothetical protein VFZ59_00520 [Verrucomicrobiae bacterium]|nr:hypothetical protein [Verrucomicrobiae bacterium]